MNVLDLFSGIGGFSLGLESTGFFKTIAFVEKDKFCQKVLRKNFPNVPIEDEIRNVKGKRFKTAEVCTSGFPCQPYSVAGKRRGTEDDRFLWGETIRIVSETKCKWFIGENVEGIINIQDGMVFRQIHDDLESEGFEVQSLVIPASGVGAWHQRKRVWIIGCNVQNSNNARRKDWTQQHRRQQTQNEEGINSSSGSDIISHGWNWNEVRSKAERCSEQNIQLQNTNSIGSQRHSLQPNNLQKKDTTREIFDTSFKEQQTWWKTVSNFYGVPNGISYELDKDRANRIKSLGNSIVPQIAREIGKAIIEAETNV